MPKEKKQNSEETRLGRLITILTLLQGKHLITASELAKRFQITVRTIYRDIKTLQQAGVPVLTDEGKGFTMMNGYKLPPFLFTENEAAAIVTAEKFVMNTGDSSLVKNYSDAVSKIRATLRYAEKDKMELLSSRLKIYSSNQYNNSKHLSALQYALTNYFLIKLVYNPVNKQDITERIVEPFALFHTSAGWMLVAFCRLRNAFRIFRLDRFQSFQVLDETFEKHKLSLTQYLESFK